MEYYLLSYNSLNIKETGTQFQCIEGVFGDIQSETLPFDGEIEIKFSLPVPFMENKAKQTSLLNVTFIPGWFLVLKEDFISFINPFLSSNFQKWKLSIKHKKDYIDNYFLFYLYETKQKEIIDFGNSIFYLGSIFDYSFIGNIIPINNYEEYLIERKKIEDLDNKYILKHKKITLNFSNQSDHLLRLINSPYGGYYVSEQLKIAIEESGFTGMSFKKVHEIDNRIEVFY
jgi:hypothetical protein